MYQRGRSEERSISIRKRFLSLALALALSLTLAVPALAVSVTEIPTEYEAGRMRFSDGMARVTDENLKYGFIDKTGHLVIPCQYDDAGDFSEGFAWVQDESLKYGFIDKTGALVVPCQYEYVSDFSEGLAYVANYAWSENRGRGYIDATGRMVISLPYAGGADFSEGLAWAQDENFKYGFIDKTGKLVIPCQYDHAGDFSEGLAAVMDESGKWGFINKAGELVIPFQYDVSGYALHFSEGLAAVMDESGKCGYIDKTGQLAIPFQFNDAGSFSEGLAAVMDESGKCGYIDTAGNVAVPFQYDSIMHIDDDEFSDGVAAAGKDGKLAILCLSGAPGFTDVPVGSYYADAVTWAVEEGITAGTGSNTFSPDNTCTTAEILTFLWRANGSPAPAGSDTSVPAGQYYSDAANWALEQGLTDRFTPNDPATRLDTVTYLWKLAGSPAAEVENPFTDLTGDARAVLWAMNEGITTGTGAATFSPGGICTRAQIVTFLYRDLAG